MYKSGLSFFLMIGAGFFLFEAILHAFGLPILEHDDIFLFTHDRYIALYALTMAALMMLVATNVSKYQIVFGIVMLSILLGIGNAMLIASQGGYEVLFPAAATVDGELSTLGIGVGIWYILTWGLFFLESKSAKKRD